MFLRKKREKTDLAALLRSVDGHLCELIAKLDAPDLGVAEEKVDPDAMSEGEIMKKWIMGEEGDGV